ncbi:hypothetical protein [Streptomyces sp. NPDC048508]|uniref:hypothetical protein n=1 Tax=Streptomyces sp. NPDC048508 TaxID=3365561 RepID=UPI003711CBE0
MYQSVVHYLNTAVGPGLFNEKLDLDEDSDTAFAAAVGLTELAGWMAHDAGRDDLASGHFNRALRLAQTLSDASAGTNVLAGMSHLALQTGRLHEAVEIARRGLIRLDAGPSVPGLSARVHAMEARALAQLNAARAAMQSLEAARKSLASVGTEGPSLWIAPFDEASLASEAASVLLDLGALDIASREARRSLTLRDASRVRGRAFGQVTLTRILLAQGELNTACSVATELLSTSQSVMSLRLSRQLDFLQSEFKRHCQKSDVRDLLSSMAAAAQYRKLLLGSLTLPESPH